MHLILFISVLVLLISIILMLAAIAILRLVRTIMEAKSAAYSAKLRILLIKFLNEDLNPAELRQLKKFRSRQLNEISESMLTKVKGRSKQILVSFLYSRGTIDQAIKRTKRVGYLGRCRAAQFLGNVGIPEAREPLERMLQDHRYDVRKMAVRSLGQLGDPNSVPALLSAIDNPRRTIPFGTVLLALINIGASGKEYVKRGLKQGGLRQRAIATEILGLVGSTEDTADLVYLLEHDPSPEVKIRSARALGRIGSPKGIISMLRCLETDQPASLRIVACGALAAIGDRQILPEIARLLNPVDYQVARAAANAVSQMGTDGIRYLNRIADSNSTGSPFAIEALARIAAKGTTASQS